MPETWNCMSVWCYLASAQPSSTFHRIQPWYVILYASAWCSQRCHMLGSTAKLLCWHATLFTFEYRSCLAFIQSFVHQKLPHLLVPNNMARWYTNFIVLGIYLHVQLYNDYSISSVSLSIFPCLLASKGSLFLPLHSDISMYPVALC